MRLIVKRLSGFNTGNDKGYVVPIAQENDDFSIIPVNPENFPKNNQISISRDFSLIEESYGPDELFYLNSYRDGWEKRDNSPEEEKRVEFEKQNSYSKARYFSFGTNTSRLESSYIEVVRLPCLPSVGSGRLPTQLMPRLPAVGIPFLALVDDYLYGPFQIRRDTTEDNQNDIIYESVNRINALGLNTHNIAKFSLKDVQKHKIILQVNSNNYVSTYLSSLHAVKALIEFEVIDFISDASLIQYFTRGEFFTDSPISRSNANTLRIAVENFVRKEHFEKSDQPRIDRLYNVLDKFIAKDTQDFELIKRYLNSPDGTKFLTGFLSIHESAILKDHIAQIRQKNEIEVDELTRKHEETLAKINANFTSAKLTVDQKIIKLNEELAEIQQQVTMEKNEFDRTKLSAEEEGLQKKIQDLRNELGIIEEIKNLQLKISRLEGRRDGVDEDIKKKQAQLDEMQSSMNHQARLIQQPALLAEKAVEMVTIKGIMNGGKFQDDHEDFEIQGLTKAAVNLVGETRNSYISSIQAEINNAGEREISYNETANLIVSVMQNYLTIFNGMPGVGKTSTVNNFANALKINAPNNKGNFLNVAVARGWTSSKDLLGNKNAIRLNYEEGRTGIYHMLKALEKCKNDPENNKANHEMLSLILLDEANLSPMEHYWSDFLSICDTFQNGKTLNLGGREKKFSLELPPSLRFIATINTDATVEPLSDRLLDRASVITLGYEDNSNKASNIIETQLFGGAVPYLELVEAFMIDQSKLNKAIEGGKLSSEFHIMNEIQSKLKMDVPNTPAIFISPRKQKAIYSYCAVANELDYNQISPIDFAFSQHVLPKIKGHGKGFKERLLALDKILTESRLPQSKRLLKQIIENGSEYADTYSLL